MPSEQDLDDFNPQICRLCWETFPNEAALVVHVAAEEMQTYDLGLTDG
jgi:hypothetical protein